jgi:hypothetical protein
LLSLESVSSSPPLLSSRAWLARRWLAPPLLLDAADERVLCLRWRPALLPPLLAPLLRRLPALLWRLLLPLPLL